MPYFTYITTNTARTFLYVGVTNDMHRQILKHGNERGGVRSVAGRHGCCRLVYFECHDTPAEAMSRGKEIKKWTRAKQEALISSVNPEWRFLNFGGYFRNGKK